MMSESWADHAVKQISNGVAAQEAEKAHKLRVEKQIERLERQIAAAASQEDNAILFACAIGVLAFLCGFGGGLLAGALF